MHGRYRCFCFAIPRNLINHLADQSEGEHGSLLKGQVSQTTKLRSQRAVQTRSQGAAKQGGKPLHRQVHDAGGQTMLPGKLLRDADEGPSRDPDANAAYDNVGIALQFYRDVLGRDSADGRGMRIDSSVHYGFRFANAMWTGEQMVVGDGDGQHVKALSHSLGIIAHELTHALSQHLVKGGLGVVQVAGQPPALKGEAGALNESFSDVFASMIKQWHGNVDARDADWLLGEDILAPKSGKAIRSLKDPGNRALTWAQDDQLKDYKRFKATDDAHKASGIANFAFYRAAVAVGGKSWEALGPIWLDGFARLRARSTFLDAAHATVDVAAARHGKGSATHEAVKAGWKEANVMA